MHSRRPALDFANSLPHWAGNREFCQILNAASIVTSQLEPYLNQVMLRARAALPDNSPLQEELRIFVQQESTHCRYHSRYNRALHEAGYDRLKSLEKMLAADYECFLESRSLKFNLAYCEGFECTGPIYAEFLFEQAADLLEGSDPQVAGLWKWHFAEEFEHRMVAHDAYHRLGGGWLYRLYRLFTTLRHLKKYNALVESHLVEIDRHGMTPEELRRSRKASRQLHRRLNWFLLFRLIRVLSPRYSPAGRRVQIGRASCRERV